MVPPRITTRRGDVVAKVTDKVMHGKNKQRDYEDDEQLPRKRVRAPLPGSFIVWGTMIQPRSASVPPLTFTFLNK
ncbi:unnamed protein product, partial [Tilletia controversa]